MVIDSHSGPYYSTWSQTLEYSAGRPASSSTLILWYYFYLQLLQNHRKRKGSRWGGQEGGDLVGPSVPPPTGIKELPALFRLPPLETGRHELSKISVAIGENDSFLLLFFIFLTTPSGAEGLLWLGDHSWGYSGDDRDRIRVGILLLEWVNLPITDKGMYHECPPRNTHLPMHHWSRICSRPHSLPQFHWCGISTLRAFPNRQAIITHANPAGSKVPNGVWTSPSHFPVCAASMASSL